MKKIIQFLLMTVGFACTWTLTHAADEKAVGPAAQEAMMAAWQKNASPGENHKRLESFVGQWKHTIRWWMSADAKPEESQGSNENKWILGNRFLQQDVKGVSMGQAFEGLSITGYDNVRGEYAVLWLDNMGTGIMSATAQFDASTNTFNENGSFACPMTGEKNMTFRAAWKIVDQDHYSYEMFTLGQDGKEFKSLEIFYERIKA